MEIKVFGAGCHDCDKLYENTKRAAEQLGVSYKIIKVEELKDIISQGVMTTPVVMVDGKLVTSGQIVSEDRMKKILEKHMNS